MNSYNSTIVGFFYSCQSIKSFRPFHSFWEEDDLPREVNTSFTERHHYHIMTIQFQCHQANSAVAYLYNFYVCSHQFLIHYKMFRGTRSIKVPNQNRTHTLQPQSTSQNFHMAWHVILCSIGYNNVPNKEIDKRAPGRVVIYISVHLVSIYTLTFRNVLLVVALYFMVHESS